MLWVRGSDPNVTAARYGGGHPGSESIILSPMWSLVPIETFTRVLRNQRSSHRPETTVSTESSLAIETKVAIARSEGSSKLLCFLHKILLTRRSLPTDFGSLHQSKPSTSTVGSSSKDFEITCSRDIASEHPPTCFAQHPRCFRLFIKPPLGQSLGVKLCALGPHGWTNVQAQELPRADAMLSLRARWQPSCDACP